MSHIETLGMNNDSCKLLVPNLYTIDVRMHKSFVLIFLPSLTGDVSVMAWFQEIPSFYYFFKDSWIEKLIMISLQQRHV